MENKKYILTEDTRNISGRTLHRIQAITDFSDVQTGDLGGWIEKEKNLSHDGTCWVYDDAIVMENARATGSAVIRDCSIVRDAAYIHGHAIIDTESCICENAAVSNSAIVRRSSVHDHAAIYSSAIVENGVSIHGNAIIAGNAHITGEFDMFGPLKFLDNGYIRSPEDYIVVGPAGEWTIIQLSTVLRTLESMLLLDAFVVLLRSSRSK